MSRQDVEKHKKIMDVEYEKNKLKPGDKGFAYDVQEVFNPEESNEWDMTEEDDW